MKGDYRKATQAINYLATKFPNSTINDLVAIKLIWLADRYHLRRFGRPVVWDQYFAMGKGPVNTLVKDIAEKTSYLKDEARQYSDEYIKRVSQYNIKSISDPDLSVFSQTDLEALNFAFSQLGDMEKFDIVKYTHEFPEWSKHKTELTDTRRMVEMDFSDFFLDPTSNIDNPFNETPEQLKESREVFEELKRVNDFWE